MTTWPARAQSWHQLQAPVQLPAEADSFTISFIIVASSPILFTPYIFDCLGLNITRGNNTNSLSQ